LRPVPNPAACADVKTIDISLASEKSDGLVEELRHVDGIVSISLQPGASLKPRGDVLTIHATNEGLQNVMALLAKYDIGEQAPVLTSEPRSLVAPFSQNQLEQETNEATWPEMAALLRRVARVEPMWNRAGRPGSSLWRGAWSPFTGNPAANTGPTTLAVRGPFFGVHGIGKDTAAS
jgi:hypothetical protein